MPNPNLATRHTRKQPRNRRRTLIVPKSDETSSSSRQRPSIAHHQHHRNRRKSKRAAQESVTEDIEEQLRRQRLKQQQQQLHNEPILSPDRACLPLPPPRRGNYVYDEQRGSYFPESSRSSKTKHESGDTVASEKISFPLNCAHSFFCGASLDRTSTVILPTLSELSSAVHQRQRLVSCWGGKAVLERLRFTPLNSNQVLALSLLMPRVSSCYVADPFYSRPGWCRSFAVIPNSMGLIYPTIVANYQGYALRFDPFREKWTQISSHSNCRAICVVDPSPDASLVGIISGGEENEPSRLDLAMLETENQEVYSARTFNVPHRANAFLCAADGCTSLWATEFYGRSPILVGTEEVRNYPRSGALCMEKSQCSRNMTFYCGHRNGQVSLVDPRSLYCASTCADRDVGNVNAMNLSMESSHLMFVQGSNGICRTFDIRQLNRCLHQLEIPFPCSKALTARCRGVAIDPSGSLVFTPFISKEREPYFAFWNILTGTFVGSRCLEKFRGCVNGERNTVPIGVPVEIGTVWTKAIKRDQNGVHQFVDATSANDDLNTEESADSVSFHGKKQNMGLWVRAGEDFHQLYFERP